MANNKQFTIIAISNGAGAAATAISCVNDEFGIIFDDPIVMPKIASTIGGTISVAAAALEQIVTLADANDQIIVCATDTAVNTLMDVLLGHEPKLLASTKLKAETRAELASAIETFGKALAETEAMVRIEAYGECFEHTLKRLDKDTPISAKPGDTLTFVKGVCEAGDCKVAKSIGGEHTVKSRTFSNGYEKLFVERVFDAYVNGQRKKLSATELLDAYAAGVTVEPVTNECERILHIVEITGTLQELLPSRFEQNRRVFKSLI